MIALGLFDGMSGGQIALTELGFPLTKYYSSEIDKFANQQIMLNFPNTVQLGSVTDVDVSKLEPIDLLLGGSPCFTAGTQVVCVNDIRPIEEIKVGDMVLTHTGCYRSVAKVGGAVKDTVTINAQGLLGTTTTSNHPYYTRTMRRVWDSERKTSYRSFSHPYWKEAGKLEKDDFICLPIISDEINYLNLTAEECFILGRYIADGHTRKDFRGSENRPNDRHWQLILSVGDKKIPVLQDRIKDNNFSCYKHGQGTHRVVLSNKRLVEIAEQHCGCGAENKHLSKTLLDLPIPLLHELIEGYLSGDGFQFAEDKFSCTTISRNLILTLGLAILKVYEVGFSCSTHYPPTTRELCGRIVNQKTLYSIRFSKRQTKQANYYIIGAECWFRFKSLDSTGKSERVYNMEVAVDNSYTADGAIVHNCQSFSFAGKRKGMATKCDIEILDLDTYLGLKAAGFEFEGQSYLFWEYVRILQDIRKYNPGVKFLLENVKMGKKWEAVLTKAIGCEGIHINSALVCAQNRRRIYWTNIEGIQQPADRGVLLRDILEDEVDEKYYLKMDAGKVCGLDLTIRKQEDSTKALVARRTDYGKEIRSAYEAGEVSAMRKEISSLEPRGDDKTNCLTGVQKDNLICVAMRGRNPENPSDRTTGAPTEQRLEPNTTGKTNCLTTVGKDNLIMGCDYRSDEGFRVRARNDESCGQSVISLTPNYMQIEGIKKTDLYTTPRIRRLTPKECCRLQTVPDWYLWAVSDTQQYKMLGNGWTIEVIKHILSYWWEGYLL